jgi:hypothetical protein
MAGREAVALSVVRVRVVPSLSLNLAAVLASDTDARRIRPLAIDSDPLIALRDDGHD